MEKQQEPTAGLNEKLPQADYINHSRANVTVMIEGCGTSKPLLKDLAHLRVAPTKWYYLGLELNISAIELDKIKANNTADIDLCKLEMFKTWLSNTPDATYTEHYM